MATTYPAFYDVLAMPRRRAYNVKEPSPQTFGHYVRQRRLELNLTQQDLASRIEELGGRMTQGDVSDLELSDSLPRPTKMQHLAQSLEVPLGKLYAEAGYPDHMPDDDVLGGLDEEKEREVRVFAALVRGEHPSPRDLDQLDRRISAYKRWVAERSERMNGIKGQ